jgi:hypothetical protein
MVRQRSSRETLVWGVGVALILSGAFLALVFLVSPLVATLVVLPAALAVSAIRTSRIPRPVAHALVAPAQADSVSVSAPKASEAANGQDAATTAA